MHAIVADVIINVVYVQVDVMGLRVYRVMLIFLFLSDASSVVYYLDNHRLFTMNVTGSPSSKYEHRHRNMSIGEHSKYEHCVTFKI